MISTRNQRASLFGLGLASLLVLPAPGSGLTGTSARRHLASLYAGESGDAADIPEGSGDLLFDRPVRDLFFEV